MSSTISQFFSQVAKIFCQKMVTLKGAEPGVLCPFVILQIVHYVGYCNIIIKFD